MEQAFLARHELYKAAVRHDADNLGVVNLAHFGYGHDGTYLGHGSIDALLVGARHLDFAYAVFLLDGDGGTSVLLHALNNLSARANNGTDKLFGNFEGFDAGNVGFEFGTWCGHGFENLAQDVLTCLLGLVKSLFKDFV